MRVWRHGRYTESGHTIGEADPDAIPPVKLRWDIKRKCMDAIDRSYRVSTGAAATAAALSWRPHCAALFFFCVA